MPKDFFNESDRNMILSAIKTAETNTSGEIRVHVDKHCADNVMDSAAYWFEKLKMHQTKDRNGILFYLAYEDHKFAILGDSGINQKVDDNFWSSLRNQMETAFKQGQFAPELANVIRSCGDQLKNHFPYQKDDVNELPDDISTGD